MAAISSERSSERMPWWAWVWPGLGWVLLTVTTAAEVSGVLAGIVGAILIAVVFAAVYHAEVVAHRVGEPYGTLVLALAVTVIEVALIVSGAGGDGGDFIRTNALVGLGVARPWLGAADGDDFR